MTANPTTPHDQPAQPSAPAPVSFKGTAHRAVAAPTRPATKRRAELPRDPTTTKPVHWILLAAIVAVAIGVRLQETASSPLIGAEDPYRHMERTWDIVQGKGFAEYPPGLTLVLLPFTFLGPDALYVVSMYIPLAFAAVMVLGMFMLGRHYIHPSGGLVAASLMAVMPESIRRTDLLFPTALDLAILPFLLLAVLKVSEGNRRALVPAGLLGGFLMLSHPWVLALALPPLAVFALVMAWRQKPEWRKAVVGIGAALALASVVFAFTATRLPQILGDLGSLATLPAYVDLPAMLTLPALLLGGVGAVLAIRSRDRFSILALLWTALLLPVVLVDWLGLWYVPHRSVVYLAMGIAMLAGVPVAELLRLLKESKPQAQPSVTFGAVGLALLVVTPTGIGMDPWYRTFSEAEMEAWHEVGDMGKYVMTGSWEARAGYRAVTGQAANFNPEFFQDDFMRQMEERDHPGLVVLMDCHSASEGTSTGALEAAGYHMQKQWGDPSCPKDEQTGLPKGWTALYVKG